MSVARLKHLINYKENIMDARNYNYRFSDYSRSHPAARIHHDILDGSRVIRVEGEGEIPALPDDPVLTENFVGGYWTSWYDNIEVVPKLNQETYPGSGRTTLHALSEHDQCHRSPGERDIYCKWCQNEMYG